MVKLFAIAAGLLVLAACAAGVSPSPAGPAPVVLPGHLAGKLLAPCSRTAPPAGEATWQPTPGDVVALEARLPQALAQSPMWPAFAGRAGDRTDPTWLQRGWHRQYVGIVRQGRRYIYGNFFPAERLMPASSATPVTVCDGGPVFFGVEFDVAAKRISHLDFNHPY